MGKPLVAVLTRTESFERVWSGLVEELGAELRVGRLPEDLAPLGDACALLVAVAGEEESGPEWLRELQRAGADEVAVVGASADHRLAVTLMAAGATNYFALPQDLDAVHGWIRERVEHAAQRVRREARSEFDRSRYDFSRIIGESPGLVRALERIARVIPRDSVTVLITGETGTGKELLAQALHHNGPRGREPFVEINCAALPENLLEAELFGFEKGAFTDARASKPGLFEAAHKGTLFLDEIGDLSLSLQAKLLKVLEDRQIRRLGSVRSVRVDVRIIAATHAQMAVMVAEGRFRRDLYYRLNVLQAELPPLRERGEDVLVLAEHFRDRFAREYDLPRRPISAEVRKALLGYAWPGNVRELRNAVERAVLLGDGELRTHDLLPEPEPQPASSGPLPFPATMTDIEETAARAMVERLGGNKTAAAEALAISRTRLYRLLGEGGT